MTKQNLKQPKLTGGTSTHRNNLVNLLLRTLLLLALMVGVNVSVWGKTLNATFGTPEEKCTWDKENKKFSWTASTKCTMPIFTFDNGQMAEYTDLKFDVSWAGEGEYPQGTFRLVFQKTNGDNVCDVYLYSMGTKNIHFASHDVLSKLTTEQLRSVAKISIGGNSAAGSVTIDPASVKLTRPNTVTFSSNNTEWGTVTAQTANGTVLKSGDKVADGTVVNFTATKKTDYLTWRWNVTGYNARYSDKTSETINDDFTIQHEFTAGVTVDIYTNDANYGDVAIEIYGKEQGKSVKVTPWPAITLKAKTKPECVFEGWYTDANHTTPAVGNDGYTYTQETFKPSITNQNVTFFAKFRQGSDYIVTWEPGVIPDGCEAWYTLGDDETKIKTTRGVTTGTKVTYHATDTGNDTKIINGWREKGTSGGNGWKGWGATYTVSSIDANLNIVPEFQDCFRVFVQAETGGTAEVSEGNGKKYFQSASPKFTATPADGYKFDGWYNSSGTKISGENPYTASLSGTGDQTFTAKFKKNVKTIGKPECNHYGTRTHGDNYFNIQQLNPAEGVTLGEYSSETGRTVTVPTTGGSMSYFFDNEYNFGDLKSWTISDNTDLQARINSIEYLDADGKQLAICYTNAGNRTLQDNENDNNLRKQLDKVKEIRINFKGNSDKYSVAAPIDYTFKWIRFTFEHADRVKPVLSEGTAKDMRVFTGENLILANGSGFWRQYTDNTYNKVKSDGFIPTNEWKQRYEIPANKLTKDADYYFRVVDEITCALGYTHSSEAVDVHVKVTDPINKVEVNGQTRQYDVYVPKNVTGTVGVVFSLHGASKDYYDDSGRINFNAIADEKKTYNDKKFIVVYPRGLMRELRGQERGWATYNEDNVEDVEFFKAIVGDIPTKYAGLTVDKNRIYLAGYANGGMMAYKAAHQAGDFFAAFASVGGFPVNESHLFHAGSQPTPFIHIQGKKDEIFNSTEYNFFTISHNMTYRNGAKFNPYDNKGDNLDDGGVIGDNTNVTREIHPAENGGAPYYLYTIEDMTHVPAYSWDGVDGDDVAPAIWNFFDKMTEYYAVEANKIDKTLKFRMSDPGELWTIATTGKSTAGVALPDGGYIGFDKVNQIVDGIHYVLSYGGRTNTKGDKGTTFDKDSRNKNMWHSLQFNGGINGAPHFLKLNVYTDNVGGTANEVATDYFLVKLTKTGDSKPVFAKRYQAGRGQKDLYINFAALPGFNEYKLEVTKSRPGLDVKVHGMEFYSGRCEDKGQEENPVFFYDVASVLTGMNPIYQPVFGKSYNGIAKEYLPIAEIPVGTLNDKDLPSDIDNTDYKVIENDLKNSDDANAAVMKSLLSTVIASTGWTENAGRYTATITGNKLFSLAQSGKDGEDTNHKSNNAFIFVPDGQTYTIDKVKGINISQLGRAKMPEYLNGTEGSFPTKGMIAIKLQGTLDFYLLAQNEVTYTGTDPNPARRTLKVYYTNDQLDGELKELKEWWFFGTRSENGYNDKNGQSLVALSAGVRLPQLGKDGTCTVFITYEGNGQGQSFSDADSDHDKIWIKGFVIKRPDLKVTIGRTDSKYSSQNYKGENNTTCTRFGENKPYVWSFENVGFNNTKKANIEEKKINAKDGRTYVCGGTDDSYDHVLLYSNGASDKNEDKVQFDGRVAGQEHIEFLKASQYNIPEATNNRKIYDPIQSNGLKVNVTGSGWFKIQCAAPNGPVNMKVYTQPNYGESYISLLREFRVDPVTDGDLKSGETKETAFREYTVYLKSRGIHNGNNGFWDGTTEDAGKEEIMRQSLFVVFDNIDNVSYDEGHPQLNIHQLSWLNEEPADYVFQREEDPKLLTTWQAIRRDDYGKMTTDEKYAPILWWKTGNDDDANYPVLKGHANGSYNVINQVNTDDAAKGVKSPGSYASTSVPSDAGTYDAYWDIAAPARVNALVEKAYGDNAKKTDTQYAYSSGNNTEFDTPVSGSFIRISAMKNTYVVAHVIPGNTSESSNATPHSGATVYVLDETGNPIPSSSSDANASRLGYIAAMVNGGSPQNGGVASQDKTIRIDFVANAGKEYFICANGASISLARLEVHNWRNWTHKPTKAETLALTDNADNRSKIETAYQTGNYYRDATLKRTFAAGKWASLVLPFSLNEQKFKEVFGENAKCIHFTDVDTENNIVKLTHHYYNMIVAGRPVFIYTPDEVVNPQFKDITLQTKDVKNTKTTSGFTFHASYDGTQMKWNDLYMNKANAIKYVSNDKSKQLTYPGMRSFIQSPNEYDPSDGRAGSVGAKAVFLSFLDDDYQDIPTGIEELISAEFGEDVVVVTKTTKIYDLLGNVMGEGSDINSLPSGIYIVNGKKYIVK